MSDERLVEDTLFLACTRPAMILGVTMEAMGLNVIFSSVLFVLAGSLLYGRRLADPLRLPARLPA
jgi:type IV secretion system protein VirB3